MGRDGPCYPTENLGKGEWHYPNGHSCGEQGILGTVWQGWRLDTDQRPGTAGQHWALVPSFNTLLQSLAAGTAHFAHTPCPPQVQEQQREDNNASCPSVPNSHTRGPRAGLPPSLAATTGGGGSPRRPQSRTAGGPARPGPAGFPVAAAPPERGPPPPIRPPLRTRGVCAGDGVSAPRSPGRPRPPRHGALRAGGEKLGEGRPRGAGRLRRESGAARSPLPSAPPPPRQSEAGRAASRRRPQAAPRHRQREGEERAAGGAQRARPARRRSAGSGGAVR